MNDHINYHVKAGLAVITLNRPDVLNALSREMVQDIRRFAYECEKDPDVFAIAITGAGRAFCSGHDIKALIAAASGVKDNAETPDLGTKSSPALFSFLLDISKPVFAAINGVAAAGGFVLAMMCDMRFVSDNASFTVGFSNRGLVAEHGLSWLLPRQLGISRALDILWSSRRIYAEEALQLGLADRVVPAGSELSAVAEYVQAMRESVSPRALAEMKAQVYQHLSADFMTAVIDSERRTKTSLTYGDVAEGANAFREKRPPRFAPWSGRK
mgnify:CR=1 FL=1